MRPLLALASLAAVACGMPPAAAQFYAGKTITMVINFAAGGDTDIQARVIQKYLPRHLQGSPSIITQYVPGAGGFTAVNLLGANIGFRPDGLSLGYFTFNPLAAVIEDPVVKVPLTDLQIVGAFRSWNYTYARKEILGDPPSPLALVKAPEIFAGGLSPISSYDLRIRLALEVLGAKFKIVSGFAGSAPVNQAMLQGEINFAMSTTPTWASYVYPNLIAPGIALPLFQYPMSDGKGGYVANAELTALGFPTLVEFYRRIYGKPPSGEKWQALMFLNEITGQLSRTAVFSHDTPPAAVAEMRKAFAEMSRDKEFAEEFKRVTHDEPELTTAEEGEALLRRLGTVQPDIKQALKDATQAK